MSYCRFGADSGVYVIKASETHDGPDFLHCELCALHLHRVGRAWRPGDRCGHREDTAEAMFWHLVEHRLLGYRVPDLALARLEAEARTGRCHG